MKYTCRVERTPEGWLASYEGADVGPLAVRAPSREAAIDKLRGELRYRLELCPCSGESYRHLQIEVTEG